MLKIRTKSFSSRHFDVLDQYVNDFLEIHNIGRYNLISIIYQNTEATVKTNAYFYATIVYEEYVTPSYEMPEEEMGEDIEDDCIEA